MHQMDAELVCSACPWHAVDQRSVSQRVVGDETEGCERSLAFGTVALGVVLVPVGRRGCTVSRGGGGRGRGRGRDSVRAGTRALSRANAKETIADVRASDGTVDDELTEVLILGARLHLRTTKEDGFVDGLTVG
jgi:hypothetical protein